MIADTFGQSSAFSLGIEEEVMILDAGTYEQVPAVATLVAEAEGAELPGVLKTELFAAVVELATGTCADVAEAAEAITTLRRFAAEAAARNGLAIGAAGSHPTSRALEQAIAPDERYRAFVDYAGSTARRQGVNGLHVHVGMASRDACFHALEGVLPWLPVVLALSANSPYLEGEERDMCSARAEVLSLLPRRGAPPAFRSYDDWERLVERMTASGLVRDYTTIWWDVRPHPRFGTLELRIPDQPTSVELTGVLAALLQALCAAVLERPPRAYDPTERGIYEQNRWAAARFGPRAQLIHPDSAAAVAVPELAAELLELVGPTARELGSAELLARLDATTCEADRQLEVGRARGLTAVSADVAVRSVP